MQVLGIKIYHAQVRASDTGPLLQIADRGELARVEAIKRRSFVVSSASLGIQF